MDGPALGVDAREAARGVPFGPDARYRLLPDRPLPQFDSPSGSACLAVDTLRPDAPLYALLCPSGLMWRRRPLNDLMRIAGRGLVNPLLASAVTLKDLGRRFVILFERPLGPSLAQFKPTSEREIAQRIVPTLLGAMFELAERGITHRAIRPNNIFFRFADSYDELLLGECVSAAPGAAQPAIFEPPERAEALPEGRGEGAGDTDLYALGMVFASLFTGRDLAALPEVLEARQRTSSFAAAMGSTRAGSAMESLLRGILRDEPAARWNVEHVHRWRSTGDERQTSGGMPRIAGHPFRFHGSSHSSVRSLAPALNAFPKDAHAACMNRSIEHWLHQSLGDSATAKRVRALRERQAQYPIADEVEFAARLCALLDPFGPIRFRNLAVMRDGLPALVAAIVLASDSARLNSLMGLLRCRLLTETALPNPSEPSAIQPTFAENLGRFAQDTAAGFGVERCLYELNPQLPCQSPQTNCECDSPAALLAEFDRLATAQKNTAASFIDRHTAAFLAAQMRSYQYRVANLSRRPRDRADDLRPEVALLGDYQALYGPTPLHGLTAWATAALTLLIKSLHNVNARDRLLERLPALSRQGELNALLKGLNLNEWFAWDEAGYRRATANDQALTNALEVLDRSGPTRSTTAAEYGHQIANAIGLAAFLIACSVTWLWLVH